MTSAERERKRQLQLWFGGMLIQAALVRECAPCSGNLPRPGGLTLDDINDSVRGPSAFHQCLMDRKWCNLRMG